MPHKDLEARRAWNRERMRRARAEGKVDPVKEAERKALWYAEGGGKAKRQQADRRRLAQKKAERISDIGKK